MSWEREPEPEQLRGGGLPQGPHAAMVRRLIAVSPATLVELVEGCDKSIATCAARFGNTANFRGEPYLPGIDLLTRYPGA